MNKWKCGLRQLKSRKIFLNSVLKKEVISSKADNTAKHCSHEDPVWICRMRMLFQFLCPFRLFHYSVWLYLLLLFLFCYLAHINWTFCPRVSNRVFWKVNLILVLFLLQEVRLHKRWLLCLSKQDFLTHPWRCVRPLTYPLHPSLRDWHSSALWSIQCLDILNPFPQISEVQIFLSV